MGLTCSFSHSKILERDCWKLDSLDFKQFFSRPFVASLTYRTQFGNSESDLSTIVVDVRAPLLYKIALMHAHV